MVKCVNVCQCVILKVQQAHKKNSFLFKYGYVSMKTMLKGTRNGMKHNLKYSFTLF